MEPSALQIPPRWDDILPSSRQRRQGSQDSVPVFIGTVNANATIQGPFLRYGSKVWDSVLVAVASVSAPVMTLQPQIVGPDGVARDVGTPVLLTGRAPTAYVPFRCHEEVRLSKRIPEGTLLLLKVTYTSGSLTGSTFHFLTTGG